jgi:CheY-like chemotaxis protein
MTALEPRPPAIRTCRALVVDADPTVAPAVRAAMLGDGEVLAVADGYQALEQLRSEAFDLVVLDWFLPGTSGAELLRRLQLLASPARIVVHTHACGREVLETAGIDAVVPKPATVAVLRDVIARAMGRH